MQAVCAEKQGICMHNNVLNCLLLGAAEQQFQELGTELLKLQIQMDFLACTGFLSR